MKLNLLKSVASLKVARGHYDLLKLSHSGFDNDFYLVNNNEDIEYNGNTYLKYPFGVVLSSKKDLTGASLIFANILRDVEIQVQKAMEANPNENIIATHQQVTIEDYNGDLVVGSTLDPVEFILISPTINRDTVSCGLTINTSLQYNLSRRTFNINDFPNINITG